MRDWPSKVSPQYSRAVFLDRDGTINEDIPNYPHKVEDLDFIPGAREALASLAKLPIHIIVISNQAGIEKGLYTQAQMSEFNSALRAKVEAVGGRIDAFYFCPDLEPNDPAAGDSPSKCAKPAPGMLVEAKRDFKDRKRNVELDFESSFVIGDKTSDIAAGSAVKCFTILVLTGKGGEEEGALEVNPDHTADSIVEAVEKVHEQLTES